MIISRKRFEEEVQKRICEQESRRRIDEDVWQLKNAVEKLTWRVEQLEHAPLMVGPPNLTAVTTEVK